MNDFNLLGVINLLEKANDNGIRISFDNDELFVTVQQEKELESPFFDEIKENKSYLIEYFRSYTGEKRMNEPQDRLKAFDREAFPRIPLSFSQERLWFIDKLQGSVHYNMPWTFRLEGIMDESLLQETFRDIIDRHEILRTVISEEAGVGYQDIMDAGRWEMQFAGKEDLSETDLQDQVSRWILRPFCLSLEYPIRAVLFRVAAEKYLLLIVIHHIAFDGWSIGIMMREMIELYQSRKENRKHRLERLPLQYADYAVWQRLYLPWDTMAAKTAYWKDKLQDTAPLGLIPDYPRPAGQSIRGNTIHRRMGNKAQQELTAFSSKEGVTLFMTLLAVYKVILYRYSGQEDICVGMPVAGRGRQELEGLIGFFVNTLPVRTRMRPEMTFMDLLREVRQATLEAYENQEVPFEKIVDTIGASRDISRNPVFQATFALQNKALAGQLVFGDLTLDTSDGENINAKFDIQLDVIESSNELHIALTYCTDLYESRRMEGLVDRYMGMLENIVAEKGFPVGRLTLLKAGEEERVAGLSNDTDSPYPREDTVVALFRAQARKNPASVALIFEKEEMTYVQLDEMSDRVAAQLIKMGIRPGSNVGLFCARGPWMIIGMLGILKSGCAYVPFNTDYPAERAAYIAADAKISFVLSPPGTTMAPVCLEGLAVIVMGDPDSYPALDGSEQVGADSCAYIMYTSGTTGHPKGIAVSHRNIVKLVYDKGDIRVLPGDRMLQWSNYAFDGSTYEIYGSLLVGATLYLIRDTAASDVTFLSRLIRSENISICFFTTALFNAFVDTDIQCLKVARKVLFGGEMVSLPHVRRALEEWGPGKIVHVYGPTETTVYATCYPVNSVGENDTIPIGKALSNTKVLIVDEYRQPVPPGTPGEIYIGGEGVSLGYVGNAALHSEKFLPMPDQPGTWYKTGDFGRWLKDGNIEFIGRRDDQVKIRGYRIELGEVLHVIQQAPGVKQAVVTAVNDSQGSRRLAAYIVPDGMFRKEAVLAFAAGKLPEYMLPSFLMEIACIPLNASGKLDKKQLPENPGLLIQSLKYEAPRNKMDRQLASIWEQLLGIELVGITDNFFERGGHSLLITRMASAIRKSMSIEVSIRELFAHPTIFSLSEYILEKPVGEWLPAVEVAPEQERWPLSFSQERLWFLDQLEGSSRYHIPTVLQLGAGVNPDALEFSLKEIIRRHEVLRSVIRTDENGKAYQQVMPSNRWTLEKRHATNKADGQELGKWINEFTSRPFILSEDYLLRALLLQLPDSKGILVIVMHHIASDGWSVSILADELKELYRSRTENRPAHLPELTVQYRDYAVWQRKYLEGAIMDAHLSYWAENLKDLQPLDIATDFNRPAVQSGRGASYEFSVNPATAKALSDLGNKEGVTLFMTLLAACSVLLHRYSGQDDIIVGTPIANRTRAEVERLVGFFVNTIVLRSEVDDEMRFTDFLQKTKELTLEAYMHQDAPLEKVVEIAGVSRDLSRNPLFQVLFALQNAPAAPASKEEQEGISAARSEHTTSKFDITFTVVSSPHGMNIALEYATDLYAAETIRRMASHFGELLSSIAADPHQRIGDLNGISERDTDLLNNDFNDTKVNYPDHKAVIDLFEEQSALTPDRIALVFDEDSLTYRQLNEKADCLASHMVQRGGRQDMSVVLCMERSIDMTVAILSILKLGCAYVPVDPCYPSDRIDQMLEDAGGCFILAARGDLGALSLKDRSKIICPGDEISEGLQKKCPAPIRTWNPDRLSYIIYTSGSTGRPKGIEMPDSALFNLLLWQQENASNRDSKRILQFASINFDASFQEIFMSLGFGGSLYLIREDRRRDFLALLTEIRKNEITHLFIPYVVLKNIAECAAAMDDYPVCLIEIFTAGEQLKLTEDIRRFFERTGAKLLNYYGPSETHVVTSYEIIPSDYANRPLPPIGKPISNTTIYILNNNRKMSGIGVMGELYVGGAQVARGYANRPDLTKERFIDDHFRGIPGARLYKTGDICRWLPDGNIEFLGRRDDQVKIRGFRVELGEIENVLLQSGMIKQAVVIARDDKSSNKMLIGYLVKAEGYHKQKILDHLKSRLPGYMIPSSLILLEALPVTANGKIDKKALPGWGSDAVLCDTYQPPITPTETILADIWTLLLEAERIGLSDNFFELGGHSIMMVQLLTRLRKCGYDLQLQDLFSYQTVGDLATYLDAVPLAERRVVSGGENAPAHLVLLQPSGHGLPVFVLPGGHGICDSYDELARGFSGVCPVYGIQMSGFFEGERPLHSIEEIAELNIEWIRKVQPQGPYRLIGHSFGGHAAYEMCRQLEKVGERVELAALLDISVHLNDSARAWINKADFVMHRAAIVFEEYHLIRKPYPDWVNQLREQLELQDVRDMVGFIAAFIQDRLPDLFGNKRFVMRLLDLQVANALIGYRPQGKVSAPLVIARADGEQWEGFGPFLGWDGMAENISCLAVPGDHLNMVKGDNVGVLIDYLRVKMGLA